MILTAINALKTILAGLALVCVSTGELKVFTKQLLQEVQVTVNPNGLVLGGKRTIEHLLSTSLVSLDVAVIAIFGCRSIALRLVGAAAISFASCHFFFNDICYFFLDEVSVIIQLWWVHPITFFALIFARVIQTEGTIGRCQPRRPAQDYVNVLRSEQGRILSHDRSVTNSPSNLFHPHATINHNLIAGIGFEAQTHTAYLLVGPQ